MRIGIILASALALGSSCFADTVSLNATYNEVPSLTQNVNINDPPFLSPGAYHAGVYNFTINAYNSGSPTSTPLTLAQVQSAIGGAGGVFQGVCIDFTHGISNGNSSNYTVANLTDIGPLQNGVGISSAQALAISYLWDNAPPFTGNTAAELQMAVWYVLYDPTFSLSPALLSGNANVGAAQADAAAAEAWAAANPTATPDVYAMLNTSGGQDFAFLIGANNGVNPVPVPSAAVSGMLLLGAFGSFRVLKRRSI